MSGSKSGNGIMLSMDIPAIVFHGPTVLPESKVYLNDDLSSLPAPNPTDAALRHEQSPVMMGSSKSIRVFVPAEDSSLNPAAKVDFSTK